MSAATVSFLTNDNALTVVSAYLMAVSQTPFEDQAKLIQSVLDRYSPKDAARLTGMPVQRIYHYKRKDLVERMSSIPLRDLVKILMLGNADM